MGFVVAQRQRVGDAHAGKGQALLLSQVRYELCEAVVQRVRCTLQHARIQQGGYILGLHWAIGYAAIGGFNFHQRFQPKHAARTVAHQHHLHATGSGFGLQTGGHFISTHRQRCAVAGHKHFHGAHAVASS